MLDRILSEVKDADVASVAQEYRVSEGFVREWMSLFNLSSSAMDYEAMTQGEAVENFLRDIKSSLSDYLDKTDRLGR